MLTNFFPPKNSLKNLIVNVLIESGNKALTVEIVKKQIKNQYAHTATYQGVSKILHFLKDENVITKSELGWKIKEEWMKTIANMLNQYTKEAAPIYKPEMKAVSFQTIGKAFEFIVENMENGSLKNGGEPIFITHVKNLAFFTLDKKQLDFLKKFCQNTECYVMVEKNNFINRLISRYLKSKGVHIYLGIARSTPYTITVYGNTLYNTFSNINLTDYLTKTYNQIKNITNIKAMKIFDSLKEDISFPIKFTFETDKEIVESTKEFLLNLAKKN